MSRQLIARNEQLARLVADGYEVEVSGSYLLIHSVPYVAADRTVKRGTLISELTMAGDHLGAPGNHVALFAGEHPCYANGARLDTIAHSPSNQLIRDGLIAAFSFSNKPPQGYPDYHAKMTRYIEIIEQQAQVLVPNITARTGRPVAGAEGDDSVHVYLDTASSRAGINAVSNKLKPIAVGIVGLGGTGSYILDVVAKTSVRQIRIFDDDILRSHNAFRAPSAASLEELRRSPPKVAYYAALYGRIHKRIVPHQVRIQPATLNLLDGLDFVFICVDHGPSRRLIVEHLVAHGITFIDVGMGVESLDDQSSLLGVLRVTTSSPRRPYNPANDNEIPFAENDEEDDYRRNIQIAELNMLNAALALVKWKKMFGLYQDLGAERHITYSVNTNELTGDA